jgi:hypothetical protein
MSMILLGSWKARAHRPSDTIASQSEPDFRYNAASELMGRIGGRGSKS